MKIIFEDLIAIREFLKSERFREVKKLPRDLGKQEYCIYNSLIFVDLSYVSNPVCSVELAAFQLGRKYERWLNNWDFKLVKNEKEQ